MWNYIFFKPWWKNKSHHRMLCFAVVFHSSQNVLGSQTDTNMHWIWFYEKVQKVVYCSLNSASPSRFYLPAWSLSRDVGCRGTWSHPLQRLQHPLPFVERPGPQERKGQAGVPETVLRGGLARHRERERSCWGDVHIESLQEGQDHTSENQF